MGEKLINELERLLYGSYRNGFCRIDEQGREDMTRVIEIYESEYVGLLNEIKCYHESKGAETC